jgi:ZIP family zinc transporter
LAEPLGAFVALMLMKGVEKSPDAIISLENILAFVAGIMVVVSMWELFPEALRHALDTKKFFWYGTISGIVIMVLTELYLP